MITIDEEEYPLDLKVITKFDYKKDYNILLLSFQTYFERHGAFKKRGNSYYLATGGWSGCEDIICALQNNYLFWSLCWQKSARGGAYWFKVPKVKGASK